MMQFMEPIMITLLSVVEIEGEIRARARAMAQDATIMIEVRFRTDEETSTPEHWKQARDQCLRYVDVA